MWYILLAIMIVSSPISAWLCHMEGKEKNLKKKKRLEIAGITFMLIGCGCLLVFILYGVGWLWYFLGGFLVIDCSDGFWEYVFNGLISLIPLCGIIGLILIAMGWDPDKR